MDMTSARDTISASDPKADIDLLQLPTPPYRGDCHGARWLTLASGGNFSSHELREPARFQEFRECGYFTRKERIVACRRCVLGALSVAAPAAAQNKKPNILFIVSDDTG